MNLKEVLNERVRELIPNLSEKQAHKIILKYHNRFYAGEQFRQSLYKIIEEKKQFDDFVTGIYTEQRRINSFDFALVLENMPFFTDKQINKLLDEVLCQKAFRLISKTEIL